MNQFLNELYTRLKDPLSWTTILLPGVNVILPALFTAISTSQLQAINAGLLIVAFLFFGVRTTVAYVRARARNAK